MNASPATPVTPVGEVMNAPVVTVDRDATLWAAMDTMVGARLRHLAVLDGGRVVGVIEDRDLASVWAMDPLGLKNRHAGEAMSNVDAFVAPGTTVVDAAREMLRRGADALVVVDDEHHPLGMVTGRDLMRALVGHHEGASAMAAD